MTDKTKSKKEAVALRLNPQIVVELKERSMLTGISQARIVEAALDLYFSSGMKRDLSSVAARLAQWKSTTLTRYGSPAYEIAEQTTNEGRTNGLRGENSGGLSVVSNLQVVYASCVDSDATGERRLRRNRDPDDTNSDGFDCIEAQKWAA